MFAEVSTNGDNLLVIIVLVLAAIALLVFIVRR